MMGNAKPPLGTIHNPPKVAYNRSHAFPLSMPPDLRRPIHYGPWFYGANRRRAAVVSVLCASQMSDVAATPESAEAKREQGGQRGQGGHGSGKAKPPKA